MNEKSDNQSLEQRVAALEAEIAELKKQLELLKDRQACAEQQVNQLHPH